MRDGLQARRGRGGAAARGVREERLQQPWLSQPRLLRVCGVLDVAQADLEPGDILVTAFTDPSWTPLLVAIARGAGDGGGRPEEPRRRNRARVRHARLGFGDLARRPRTPDSCVIERL